MRHLNPYVHTCSDQQGLVCPACRWAEVRQSVDVLVHNEGTIWLFNPLSERAKARVAEHVAAESWQWLCVCRKLKKLTRLLQAADRIRAERQAETAFAATAGN